MSTTKVYGTDRTVQYNFNYTGMYLYYSTLYSYDNVRVQYNALYL